VVFEGFFSTGDPVKTSKSNNNSYKTNRTV
jgi:hypothetical protein